MITAIIIDDEKNAAEALEWQLCTYCKQVSVTAVCHSADDGIAVIKKHQPQLLFLDIEMPKKNGFEVLQAFPELFFDVIFTTAYNQFALKAFKFAALDYLLKPIDADDLMASVDRYEKRTANTPLQQQLHLLMQQYRQPEVLPDKLPFTTLEAIHFVNPYDVIYCESSSNYTILYFENKQKLVVSKTLKEVEEILLPYRFYRVHHSYLVNLRSVNRYIKSEGGSLQMSDGAQLPVSRQRKDDIIQILMHTK